jgi:hypothetical protein
VAEQRKVRTETPWTEFLDPVFLEGGYAIPRMFRAHHEYPGVRVELEIHIEDGRARARRLTVESDRPGGIGLDVLRGIEVRNIVTTAVLDRLHRATTHPDGTVSLMQVGPANADRWDAHADNWEEIRDLVQKLVGWVQPKEPER